MEQLGLGVRLKLDDDMTKEINPIVRDLERLRQQAQRTTKTFNDMRNAHNPFGSNKRQEVRDYFDSMRSADRVLLNISDRFIRATKSANDLGRAMNRMQFSGRFNLMYSDIMRVQRMLGQMGYGMSKMQKEMSNLRAFNMMDVQLKDLHDKIKLTDKALKEMQKSPDSKHMVKEMDIAKRSLQAYRNELSRVGSLQEKLAKTHGLGTMKSFTGAKDILYQREENFGKNIQNRLAGLAMGDMALASAIATKSLNATERALVGTGYTAMETKQKLTQMAGAMQQLGMTLTTTLSLVSAIGIAGVGYLAGQEEKANSQFTGQSLVPIGDAKGYQSSMRNAYGNSSGSNRENLARMFSTMFNGGITNLGSMEMLSKGANEIGYAQGIDSVEVLNSVLGVARKTGHSYADSLDLIALGLKKTNGDLEGATDAVLKNAGAFKTANGEWRNAYDILEAGNKDGSINKLVQSAKGLANTLAIIWEGGLKQIIGGFATLVTNVTNATNAFLEAHPVITRFLGMLVGATLIIGLVAGPILLVTGLMLRFRSGIQGVGLAIQALSARGGVAVLGAQSTMLAKQVHSAVVGLARFPQTLLFGVMPALYGVLRMIPNFILNMMRINPVMSVLTAGVIAYNKNWFGFGDTVRGTMDKIKSTVAGAKGILATAINGGDVDFSKYTAFEGVLAKTMGTANVAKDVIKSIFTGEALKLSAEQTNLIDGLGIGGAIDGITRFARGFKDFVTGFVDGIELVYNSAKTFFTWMVDTFEPLIVRLANFISKLFGGSGTAKSVEDIMNSANGMNNTMRDLGKVAGIALTALLGFKLVKPILGGMFSSLVKNPFGGLITSANNAKKAVKDLAGVMGNRGGRGGGGTGGGGGYTTTLGNTVLTRNSPPPLTATQQRYSSVLTTNANARARGYDVGAGTALRGNQPGVLGRSSMINPDGTYRGSNANLNGQQVHRRQQGAFSRALFGQAYDVYGADGRRTQINRQGGLLRRSSSDDRIGESMAVRDRMSLAGQNARNRVSSMGQSAMGNIRSAGTAMMNTPGMNRVRSAGSAVANVGRTAMKPITVPVNYVTGRLQTAGVIRQANQGGRQSGNAFKRAFNLVTRTGMGGARMFGGAIKGAGSAGAKAGSGMLKGMSFVSKGIGGIFKAGLRAIPILGWALMAWDIISTIFTNWDAIKSAALKAWEWIKTKGYDMAKNVVSYIGETLTGFITTAGSIATSIGSAMLTGIKSAMSGLGDWLGAQIAKVPGGSFVVEKLTGKKYARGGIINSPHMGLVGEAGPEAIIPLSGNQRDRAKYLLQHTAGVLGMSVSPEEQTRRNLMDVDNAPVKGVSKPVVRTANAGTPQNNGSGSQDNSVTINAVHVNIPQGTQVTPQTGKQMAKELAKELQKIMKQERLRSSGKNLTLEDLILNM